MKPMVYVVQTPPQGKNILPAKEFGELRVLLNGKENRSEAIMKLAQGLQTFDGDNDYLLPMGHPINIGIASHIVLSMTQGTMKVLLWKPDQYKYEEEHVKL